MMMMMMMMILYRCDNSNGRVDYPSLELCEKTREPCRLVEHFVKDWPEFLRCTQPYFKQNCGVSIYISYTIPSLISLMVSVDVKHHERKKEVSIPVSVT